jgi:hypothetical protein
MPAFVANTEIRIHWRFPRLELRIECAQLHLDQVPVLPRKSRRRREDVRGARSFPDVLGCTGRVVECRPDCAILAGRSRYVCVNRCVSECQQSALLESRIHDWIDRGEIRAKDGVASLRERTHENLLRVRIAELAYKNA